MNSNVSVSLVQEGSLCIQVGEGLAGLAHEAAVLDAGGACFDFGKRYLQVDAAAVLFQMAYGGIAVDHAAASGDNMAATVQGEDIAFFLLLQRVGSFLVNDCLQGTFFSCLYQNIGVEERACQQFRQHHTHSAFAAPRHADQYDVAIRMDKGIHGCTPFFLEVVCSLNGAACNLYVELFQGCPYNDEYGA